MKLDRNNIRIAIIGLGYVGLPLAIAFAKKYPVIGFDIKQSRIDKINLGQDSTLEFSSKELDDIIQKENPIKKGLGPRIKIPKNKIQKTHSNTHLEIRNSTLENKSSSLTYHKPLFDKGLFLTSNTQDIEDCNYYIITVPTPIDKSNRVNITPLLRASEIVGSVIKKNNIVIYESTVYPGATEEDCVPVLEKNSGLIYNVDFFVGYSPERINPGDKEHTLTTIIKITSGSTPEIGELINDLYLEIIAAGTHLTSSIKVAEAAKVIENAQRDINIAFINELAIIFNLMNIDTSQVLEAAQTKWNFLPFRPGLVGGHCIGVDPYYLAQKSQTLGYIPEIILGGRRINDNMSLYIANNIIKLLSRKGNIILGSKFLILGITFKENCPDIRNSKVFDLIENLKEFGCEIEVFDPYADSIEVNNDFNIKLISEKQMHSTKYNSIILAVAHNEFKEFDYYALKYDQNSIIYDLKSILPQDIVDGRL